MDLRPRRKSKRWGRVGALRPLQVRCVQRGQSVSSRARISSRFRAGSHRYNRPFPSGHERFGKGMFQATPVWKVKFEAIP